MESGVCDSCGDTDRTDLVRLHRLYVRPRPADEGADEGDGPIVTRVDDVERWCAACRTHYPHEGVDT